MLPARPPAPRIQIIETGRKVATHGRAIVRRARGFLGNLGGGRPLLDVGTTLKGAGGGMLSGLAHDIVTTVRDGSDETNAMISYGAVAALAWVTGMPKEVVAGAAGGEARAYYDKKTGG